LKKNNKTFLPLAYTFAVLILLLAAGGWHAVHAEPFLPGGWAKATGNPIFNHGTSGAWNDQWVYAPSVFLDGSTYKMWYVSFSAASTSRKIGYATSPNGVDWTKYGNAPVLSPGSAGSWDAGGVSFPTVIKEGSTYKMWYTGMDAAGIGRVGYATSADGITWTKYAGNPVMNVGASGSWDSTYVGMTSVIKVGSAYKLWYRGGSATGGAIGYATSPDGLAWTKYDPAITGGSGAWDTTPYHPEVIFDGMVYHMWYSGCNQAEDLCQVGYAISPDGANWTRKGMVLPQGASGAWDGQGADHAAVLLVGSTLKMWYSGYNGSFYQIGYASAANLDRKTFIPLVMK
jgi:predicted GH43/DUF377 family glycosyl hydrolase